MATAKVAIAYALLITNVVLGIFLVCSCYRFWQRRNETIFIKRRGNIAVAFSIAACIILLISFPAQFLVASLINVQHPATYAILDVCVDAFFVVSYHSMAWLVLCRNWLIFYDIQFAHSCLNLEWKQCITNNLESLKKETWFIDKRATFGNTAYLLKRLCIIGAVFAFLVIALPRFGLLAIVHAIQATIFVAALIFIVTAWRKLPYFNDNIFLYREFILGFYVWVIGFLLYCTAISIGLFGFQLAVTTAMAVTFTFQAFLPPFISTFWVLYQINLSRQFELSTSALDMVQDLSVSETDSVNEILSDIDTLNLFMQHLVKDFCVEILLSLIEFHQFRNAALNAMKQEGMDAAIEQVATVKPMNLNITEDAPRSDIVYGATQLDGVEKYIEIACRLYQKYIVSGAEFEINISFRTKQTLNSFVHVYEEWIKGNDTKLIAEWIDVATLYDEAMLEMMQLLNTANARFVYDKV